MVIKKEQNPEYRPNVAAIILNNENRVFLGERVDAPGSWQVPQGGIDFKKGETEIEALWRELSEELGIDDPEKKFKILAKHPGWLKYDFPKWVKEKGGWLEKYKGQNQKYFLLRFFGDESEITLERDGKREFRAFKWGDLETITESVADFKLQVLKKAMEWAYQIIIKGVQQ